MPPGSLQRSSVAIDLTVAGSAFRNALASNGLNRRTFTRPIFSPCFTIRSTASSATSAPEPIKMITRSASGAP